jgi:hypothetical protein
MGHIIPIHRAVIDNIAIEATTRMHAARVTRFCRFRFLNKNIAITNIMADITPTIISGSMFIALKHVSDSGLPLSDTPPKGSTHSSTIKMAARKSSTDCQRCITIKIGLFI